MNLFLTGTDTGVGKTHTAVQLLRAGRASGLALRRHEADLLRRPERRGAFARGQ
jgi:hypothetical protein